MRNRKPHTLSLILVVVLALVGGTASYIQGRDSAQRARVTAVFADASPLVAGNDVKTSGVKVGEVSSLSVHNGQAHVVMDLDPATLPLHRDAKATVRPVSLLGERFVDLDRGSASAPILEQPAVIAAENTDSSVDLDEVLNALDAPTAHSLAALLTTLGEGVRGQGAKVDAAIAELGPAMTQTGRLARMLDRQNAVLTGLVDRVEPVSEALASDRGRDLDRLVGSTESMLKAAADNRRALDESLAQLPGTLRKAERTLGRLAGVADAATPALASIRPVTNNLRDISTELQRMADATDPALASLQPVLEHAESLIDEAAPLVETLGSAGRDLRGVAASARPVAERLMDNLRNVLNFVRYWALATNGYDGLSHYFRANIVVNPESVTGLVPRPQDAGREAADSKRTPSRPPAVGEDASNVTGLTRDQEQSLVGQLLGGL
ncbi:hypothetical protein GCM10025762_38900 [Haloechinothrix salitolerans]